jgi:zinc protease
VRTLGVALETGRTVEDVEAWPERIGQVSAAQVNAAAAYVFRPEQSVTGRLVAAPASTAVAAPSPAAPPAAATGEREIGAGQETNG